MTTPALPEYVADAQTSTQIVHTPPPTSDQWQNLSDDEIKSLRAKLITSILQIVIQSITGTLDPSGGLTNAVAQLSSWAGALQGQVANLPVLSDLIELLTGIEDGNPADLGSWALNLRKALTNFVNGQFSIGALTSAAPGLLLDTGFAASSIASNPDWTVDTASTRTADGTGSAKVTFNGRHKALRSGTGPSDVITTGPGQKLTSTIYCSHDNYSGVGDEAPIQLQFAVFRNNVFSEFVTLDSYTPTTANLAWPGHKLTGSYAVPDDVTGIQKRIYVLDGALSGTGRFDDASIVRAAVLLKSLIDGLEDDLNASYNRWQGLVDTIATGASGIPIINADLGDVAHAISTFNPANIVGALGGQSVAVDMQSILNHMVAAVKNKRVDATSPSSLADLYNAVNQAINNTAGEDVTTFVDTSIVIPVDPSWANYLDIVGVGKGQEGGDGLTLGFFGEGGGGGKFNATTWAKGTHYDGTLTGVTVTVNSNGSITFAIPGHSMTAVPNPVTQTPHLGSGWPGLGPGIFQYNGKPYAGGSNQNTPGAAGLGPGGGGAGGAGVLFQAGGPGAAAGGWVRARAADVDNPSTGADTTPPSLPTPTVVSATNTSIILSASGSVDG